MIFIKKRFFGIFTKTTNYKKIKVVAFSLQEFPNIDKFIMKFYKSENEAKSGKKIFDRK